MSSQQLVNDYNQLKKLLRAYPDIFILKTTGQPPDNYEIEYSIRGYIRDADDQINIGDRHRVRISLPFGYPHFAPIVKPLTHIFHPDIDPAAIRIAEWWAQNPSLPELVLYIGEMIRGRIYNLEDPFNPEAAEWYKTYQSQLPLDEVRTLEVADDDSPVSSAPSASFDASGLEVLGLEKSEKPDEEPVAEAHQPDESDIQQIHELVEAKKIFTANAMLIDLPTAIPFPDREELQKDIAKVLRKTDQLFSLVEQLENLRKYDEALETVDSIALIASDAPGLEETRARLQEAASIAVASGERAQKIRKAQWEKAKQAKSKRKQTDLRTIMLPLIVLVFLGLCGGVGFLMYQDQQTLGKADNLLKEGQKQIKTNMFPQARSTLEDAQTVLNNLVVLQFLDKQAPLQAEIAKALQSKELREGLEGRVLYEGKYISVLEAVKRRKFNELKGKAMSFAQANRLKEALAAYGAAAGYAEKEGFLEEKASLDEHFYPLTLRYLLEQAEQAERTGDLDKAAAFYEQAQDFSGEAPQVAGLPSDLSQRLSEITFRQEVDASRQAFIKSQWEQTISSLERAQKYALEHPKIVTEKDRQDLQRLLDNARLNMRLATAKEAVLTRKWQTAIENYNLALELLAAKASTFRQIDDEIITKIERILLQVRIMEQKEQAMIAENRRDLPNTVRYNQEIQRLILGSPFSGAPELQPVLDDTVKKSNYAKKELVRKEQVEYLEKNYERLFRSDYATLQGSQLLKPKAVFVKNIGSNPLYSLTCLERDLGRTTKIELRYLFNNNSRKWQVYSER